MQGVAKMNEENQKTLASHIPLTRAKVKGWVNVVFWGLRIYIALMLVLVVIGLLKGNV